MPKCSWISIESPAESLDRMVAAHPPTKYAICVWPAPAREISIRGLAKETGRSIAAFDAEKTLQRNAGISNIVLA